MYFNYCTIRGFWVRSILINAGLLLFAMASFGQGQLARAGNLLKSVRTMYITLDTSARSVQSQKLPFEAISLSDVRFDTTYIGIYSVFSNLFIPTAKNYKINFEGGAGRSFETYFNHFFSSNFTNGNLKLICFLKKLDIVKRDTLAEHNSLHKAFGQANFKVDVFLRSGDNFYAAFKIDTVLVDQIGTKKKEFKDEVNEYFLLPALKLLQTKIINTNWENVLRKKSFTESAVHQNYYNKRFNLPILTEPYKKGIFGTFAEFVNNSPSIIDFRVKRDRAGGVSLLDKNSKYLITTKIFGFSDGEKCWIQRGIFCYPLIRTANSFEFFLTVSTAKFLFVVDMDKGEIL